MDISRRQFLKSLGLPLLSIVMPATYFWRLAAVAADFVYKKFPKVRVRDNLFMAFNNIKNPEAGESDEFTTIRNIQHILSDMDVAPGTTVIGIGARTGHPDKPYAMPGEMGYVWKTGEAWNAKVTSPVDARPLPLLLDDPIVVTQVGVLHESTAHHFEIDGSDLEGTVLWSFYNDDTGAPAIDSGMHNLFSDLDGGMLEEVFKISRRAKNNPNDWSNDKVRQKLRKYLPNLSDDLVWRNFSETLAKPYVHSQWLPYVRSKGWPGAAIILRGSMENVGQFHLREWVRKNPREPQFEIGKGTHTFLKIKAGREARPFISVDEASWTMVGFIWDLDSSDPIPSMKTYRDFSDIFGQDFHIHGFRDDQSIGGHTLFALLGSGKLSVSLYPLTFEREETAFLFNNDLMILPKTIRQSNNGLSVSIKNNGENFVRNVAIRLSKKTIVGTHYSSEEKLIPLIRPGEVMKISFEGAAARDPNARRCLWLDRKGHFLEGGEGKKNNRLDF